MVDLLWLTHFGCWCKDNVHVSRTSKWCKQMRSSCVHTMPPKCSTPTPRCRWSPRWRALAHCLAKP